MDKFVAEKITDLGDTPPPPFTDIPSKIILDSIRKSCDVLNILGPGRPSAGGPRMDRRAVTSSGVVKILSRQRGEKP